MVGATTYVCVVFVAGIIKVWWYVCMSVYVCECIR